jgi:hypothetical protein
MGFQSSRNRTAISQHAGDLTASRHDLTIHWLHILVKYVLAMTELERNSNLIANLDDLTLTEVLATRVSTYFI